MAAPVCDLCGGKLVMSAGGIAICDNCGMEYSSDRMREKILEIKGTVVIDNNHMIDNYLEMADNAFDAGNNQEAEAYCNKIIEINPTHYEAWLIKGEAAGWQSTLKYPRLSESVSAFTKAIEYAPPEEKSSVIQIVKLQFNNLSTALVNLRGDLFVKIPDAEETTGFISDIASILNSAIQLINQAHISIPATDLTAPMTSAICTAVLNAYSKVIFPDYNGDPNDPNDRPNKYRWQKYINRIDNCITLIEKAISLCPNDYKSNIDMYESLITLQNNAIKSCAWDYRYDYNLSYNKFWYVSWTLTNESIATRKGYIYNYEKKIKEIKKALAKKEEEEREQRIKDYWDSHKEERDALESEKKSLNSQKAQYIDEISQLQQQKNGVDALVRLIQVQKTIEQLTAEKKSLGLFKLKEKKAIQEKIDAQVINKNNLKGQVAAQQQEIEQKIIPIRAKLNEAIDRLNEIDDELTKNR